MGLLYSPTDGLYDLGGQLNQAEEAILHLPIAYT